MCRSWCVITQMLGVDQVLYVGLQLICAIMFHPAFHFEARTSWYASVALIIISAPLPFPCPVSLCHALSLNPGQPGCRSLRTWRWNAYLGHLQIGVGGWGTVLDSIQFSKSNWGIKWNLTMLSLRSNWSLKCAALMDRLRSPLTFFFTIRMPQNAQCVDVRVPVRSCTSCIQSSSIISVRMAV